MGRATVQEGHCQRPVNLQGLAVVGNGLVGLALLDMGQAAVDIGQRQLRIEFQGLAVIGDGPVEVALG